LPAAGPAQPVPAQPNKLQIDRHNQIVDIIAASALQQVFENWSNTDRHWVPQVIELEQYYMNTTRDSSIVFLFSMKLT
jgi:hypothetical protein